MGERKDFLLLIGKSLLMVFGGILLLAGLVDLVVDGPDRRNLGALLAGLALGVPPLAFAFRDALREARKGRRGS